MSNPHPLTRIEAGSAEADTGEHDSGWVSKSQRKREMTALQQLGERLVDLSTERLAQLPLDDKLRDAIAEARRITAREGRRRQMQYIGRLMRQADSETIAHQLRMWDEGAHSENARFHEIERWRERLLDSDTHLTEFLSRHPGADAQHLRSLIRAARKESASNAALPPDRPPQRRQFRALFQALREVMETDGASSGEAPAPGVL